ncbi:MAG: VTT domain-containing protein [Candidatus Levybacteria bacterium]|nr:VTT domain-containing protein [Candidatus Levybacteria bacterium]
MHGDLAGIIEAVGYIGLFGIVFAETGLLIGFFLPGDSLLFTAGFLASQGIFNIYILCFIMFIAAVTGDSVGYLIGHKYGKRLFQKEDSLLFHKDHLVRAKNFYEKHGGKTIILARFMPVIRTFAPVVAGIGDMRYSTFLAYNVIGGIFWAIGLPTLGYILGSSIPDVDKYLLPIIALIVLVSVAPGIYHTLKTKEQRAALLKAFKSLRK